ncbi:MAG: hypothetical protein R3C28_33055 [Pirellulaceae bacterium]
MKDRFEIMIIRFVSRVECFAKMIRREGMHDSRVEAGFAEGSLDRFVIDAGHFHSHDRVGQFFRLARFTDELRHHSQSAGCVFDGHRLDDDLAIEITKHPLRAPLRTVDRHDAKVLWPDSLNPLLDLSRRLTNKSLFRARGFSFLGLRNHLHVS